MNSRAPARPRSDSPASWSPAAQPSVRRCRRATSSAAEAQAERTVEQALGLDVREAQVGAAQLDQLGARPQAPERERWIRARRDCRAAGSGAGGRAGRRPPRAPRRRRSGGSRRAPGPSAAPAPASSLMSSGQDRARHAGARRAQRALRRPADLRVHGLQRRDGAGPELDRVRVLRVQREPREGGAQRGRAPLREQRGLARARREPRPGRASRPRSRPAGRPAPRRGMCPLRVAGMWSLVATTIGVSARAPVRRVRAGVLTAPSAPRRPATAPR